MISIPVFSSTIVYTLLLKIKLSLKQQQLQLKAWFFERHAVCIIFRCPKNTKMKRSEYDGNFAKPATIICTISVSRVGKSGIQEVLRLIWYRYYVPIYLNQRLWIGNTNQLFTGFFNEISFHNFWTNQKKSCLISVTFC